MVGSIEDKGILFVEFFHCVAFNWVLYWSILERNSPKYVPIWIRDAYKFDDELVIRKQLLDIKIWPKYSYISLANVATKKKIWLEIRFPADLRSVPEIFCAINQCQSEATFSNKFISAKRKNEMKKKSYSIHFNLTHGDFETSFAIFATWMNISNDVIIYYKTGICQNCFDHINRV